MKRTLAVLTFVFAIAVSGFAATTSPSAPALTKKQLNSLIAEAKTPADHQKIAAYYHAQAEQYLAESNAHTKMAAELAKNPATNNSKRAAGTVQHCEYVAQTLKTKSLQAEKLAGEHEQMARDAVQQ